MRAAIAGTVIVGSITVYKLLDYKIRWNAQKAKKKGRRMLHLQERSERDLKPVPPIRNVKELLKFLWDELRDYGKDVVACFKPKKKEMDLRGNLPEVRAILEQCHNIHQTNQILVEYSIMLGNARYYAEMYGAQDEEEMRMGPIHPIFAF